MKRATLIITILILLLNTTTILAAPGFEMGFNRLQSKYQLNDSFSERMVLKELIGGVNLDSGLSLQASYTFGDYDNYLDANLKEVNLKLTKDFLFSPEKKLALGIAGNYSNFTTSIFSQKLFNIESQGLDLVVDLEKRLTERIGLFANGGYNLAGRYQIDSPLLNNNLEQLTNYEINSDYYLQTGFKFKLAPQLKFRFGYKISRENIKNKDFNNLKIDAYNLSEVNILKQGIFFGAETKF
ncbi:hypothetical protein Halha_0510 [Halobacteroides halobius DSM 5150]|uniref:Outer membrane protein beta-barrel domain-containing protein n=1 Tax=Halobacteroides halobius (strain ATCC 35273 / DSM 5150 / MD-1) TaxID=748449 RepID=L0K803_HALHC|nr:hypothetical protein [Halobacteroides halobius]AGB40484.1 hypothetical protein Halha_0510 [Halobacteroides halobius DSM 5150]